MDLMERGMNLSVENAEFPALNHTMNSLQLNVLEHGLLRTGREWNFPGLSSPFNRLYFILSGGATVKNERNDLTMEAGNMYLIPLRNAYDYACPSEMSKFYIHFRVELVPGQDLFEGCELCMAKPVDGGFVRELIEKAQSGKITDTVALKGMLTGCVAAFLEPRADEIRERLEVSRKYADLYQYIREHCCADLRVKDIAGHYGIPLTNLSKSFKAATGQSLKKYIESKVLQKAQEKLLVTDMPVKDIAYSLRFSDEFHFSRFFKRHCGISPSQYRQRSNHYK